jgi:hypothetical protein
MGLLRERGVSFQRTRNLAVYVGDNVRLRGKLNRYRGTSDTTLRAINSQPPGSRPPNDSAAQRSFAVTVDQPTLPEDGPVLIGKSLVNPMTSSRTELPATS